MEYPLLKNCYPDWIAEVSKLYNALVDINYRDRMVIYRGYVQLIGASGVKPLFRNRSGKYMKFMITHKESDYWNYNVISDFFTEPARIKCHKKGCIPLADYWEQNQSTIVAAVGTDTLACREEIFNRYGQGRNECTLHRPIVSIVIYKYFHAKRILDPCAGWGGRMIAALSTKCELYVGIDPNEDLHPCYAEIQQTLGGNSEMFCCPFEDFIWHGKLFDIAYTSPPYFDLEVYGNSPGQSILQYPEISQWIKCFLIPLLDNCIRYVKTGGIIAINISETKQAKYVTQMLDYMRARGQEYLGVIGFARKDPSQAMPIFIWRRCQ